MQPTANKPTTLSEEHKMTMITPCNPNSDAVITTIMSKLGLESELLTLACNDLQRACWQSATGINLDGMANALSAGAEVIEYLDLHTLFNNNIEQVANAVNDPFTTNTEKHQNNIDDAIFQICDLIVALKTTPTEEQKMTTTDERMNGKIESAEPAELFRSVNDLNTMFCIVSVLPDIEYEEAVKIMRSINYATNHIEYDHWTPVLQLDEVSQVVFMVTPECNVASADFTAAQILDLIASYVIK